MRDIFLRDIKVACLFFRGRVSCPSHTAGIASHNEELPAADQMILCMKQTGDVCRSACRADKSFSHQRLLFFSSGRAASRRNARSKTEPARDTLLPVLYDSGSNLNVTVWLPAGRVIPLRT